MLTGMTDEDWSITLKVFDAARSGRGQPGRNEGLPQSWGSRGYSHERVRIVGGFESLSETGTESAIINGASNLQQQIGAAS